MMRAALLLARICVNEAGFDGAQDCIAIAEVVRANSGEITPGALELHAPRATGSKPPLNAHQAWTQQLDEDGTEPAAWRLAHPALPWERYRERWLRVLRGCQLIVRGQVDRVCREVPIAWGGAMDRHIAERRGLVRVDCGNTRNEFWGRP